MHSDSDSVCGFREIRERKPFRKPKDKPAGTIRQGIGQPQRSIKGTKVFVLIGLSSLRISAFLCASAVNRLSAHIYRRGAEERRDSKTPSIFEDKPLEP